MELIIILVILFFCGKHILFNVRLNSVIIMILEIVAVSLRPPLIPMTNLVLMLLALNIIDCIRDLVVAGDFYRSMDYGLDSMFVIKSLMTVASGLLGWFLWGHNLIYVLIPRAAFLCCVYPAIAIDVRLDVSDKVTVGYPLPYSKWHYSKSRKSCYYYEKLVKKLYDNGKLVSNADIIDAERDISNAKYAKAYPKTKLEKIANFFNKEHKNEMATIEKALDNKTLIYHAAYINSDYFELYADKIAAAIKANGGKFLSPWKIKELADLNDLHLNEMNGYNSDVKWSEYFIIKSLKQLVKEGKLKDHSYYSENNPLENHAYGTKEKKNDLTNNPLFADLC